MELQGERVILRTPSATDADEVKIYRKWFSDPKIIRYLSLTNMEDLSENEVRSYLKKISKSNGPIQGFTVIAAQDNQYIGCGGFMNFLPGISAQGGLLIADSKQYPDLGREAATLLLNYAFEELGLKKVWVLVKPSFKPLLTLAESLGFTQAAILNDISLPGTKYVDYLKLDLPADQWLSAH